MKLSRTLPVTLALSLIVASCGQTPTPSANDEAVGTMEVSGGQGLSAAYATVCDVIQNHSAYCNTGLPGTQYRYRVRCYDDGLANRFTSDAGAWRNQSGTYRSYATCPAGDSLAEQFVDWR